MFLVENLRAGTRVWNTVMVVTIHPSERFRTIYDTNVVVVYRFLWRRTGSDAEELTSDVMAALWQNLDRVGDGVDATRWLLATSRNVWFNHYRKQQRRSQAVLHLSEVHLDSHDREGFSAANEGVARVLQLLKPAQAELLIMRYWDDLDVVDIASIVGSRPDVVSRRLWKARQRFARLYGEITAGGDMNTLRGRYMA